MAHYVRLMESRGKGPAKVVMDLDASMEVYEEWGDEEIARETQEVEDEVLNHEP